MSSDVPERRGVQLCFRCNVCDVVCWTYAQVGHHLVSSHPSLRLVRLVEAGGAARQVAPVVTLSEAVEASNGRVS